MKKLLLIGIATWVSISATAQSKLEGIISVNPIDKPIQKYKDSKAFSQFKIGALYNFDSYFSLGAGVGLDLFESTKHLAFISGQVQYPTSRRTQPFLSLSTGVEMPKSIKNTKQYIAPEIGAIVKIVPNFALRLSAGYYHTFWGKKAYGPFANERAQQRIYFTVGIQF